MRVRELMTVNPITVEADRPLKEAAVLMAENHISGVPVVDSANRVIGILSEADFVDIVGDDDHRGLIAALFSGRARPRSGSVGDVMTRKAITVEANESHVTVARLMKRKGVKRLPVVDGSGAIVGIISRADLLGIYAREDADLHREILDHIMGQVMGIDGSGLTVEVDRGCVKLLGTLSTRTETQLLEYLCGEVPGVIAVESSLRFETDDIRLSTEAVPFGPPRNW